MALVDQMPVKDIADMVEVEDTRLWRIIEHYVNTGRAYRMKLVFQQIFSTESVSFDRTEALLRWYQWAVRSRIEPIVAFAKALKKHWEGITRWFASKINNAILEGLNSLVQAAKARTRGFRSIEYFKLIIYRVAGKLGYLPI